MEGRVALTLRLVGGLTAAEIARAFLTSESAIQQRIVRAKRTLGEARVPFEVPGAADRAERLASVLEVIYLIFNEGYAATSGEDWMRPALCEEALRVGRILAEIDPTAAGGPRPGRPDGTAGLPDSSAGERIGRAHFVAQTESLPVGSTADPPRIRGARSCGEF